MKRGCIAGSVCLVAVVALLVTFVALDGEVAADVSQEGLLAIRPGMGRAEVIALLGSPLRERQKTSGVVLEYAESGRWGFGFEIAVELREGRVHGMWVTHADLAVLSCTEERCPQQYGSFALGLLHRKRPGS